MAAKEKSKKPEGLVVLRVPIDDLIPNPWNPNVQNDRTYEAERESIRLYGFVDPVTVRAHPTKKGKWEIIDGEHRWRGAKDEGHDEIDIIPLELDDASAKKLTVILNETRGEADIVPLGKLLAGLQASMPIDDLLLGLPYDKTQLAELMKLGTIDWDNFDREQSEKIERHMREAVKPTGQFAVVLEFDQGQRERYNAFIAMVQAEKDWLNPEDIVLDSLTQTCQSL